MLTTSNAPEMFSVVSALIVVASAGLILVMSVAIILRMDGRTDHFVRLYYTTLAASAFYELLWVAVDHHVNFGETLLCLSVAMGMVFDRRVRPRTAMIQITGNHHVSK